MAMHVHCSNYLWMIPVTSQESKMSMIGLLLAGNTSEFNLPGREYFLRSTVEDSGKSGNSGHITGHKEFKQWHPRFTARDRVHLFTYLTMYIATFLIWIMRKFACLFLFTFSESRTVFYIIGRLNFTILQHVLWIYIKYYVRSSTVHKLDFYIKKTSLFNFAGQSPDSICSHSL